MIAVLLIGFASVMVCVWRRAWVDALLVLLAALALGGLVGQWSLPAGLGGSVAVTPVLRARDLGNAARLTLAGDGLRAAQWQDLPALPLEWSAPQSDVLRLEFPRRLALGRMFSLTVQRAHPGAGRLQLLAENGQVLAEASGTTPALSVQWMPPVAESLVLTARLSGADGAVVAQGPVPLTVRAAEPLQVQGRFGAPSFDAQSLNQLLVNSNAILDWQVTLGKAVTRNETARTPMTAPELLVVDAAYVERMNASARSALLAQVGAGVPLVVLGGNAAEPGFWASQFQLALKAQPENQLVGTPLAMTVAPFNPSGASGPWEGSQQRWTRAWQKGRIVWLGVADWHKYAISEPLALGLWWQGVLDAAGVERHEDVAWLDPEEMPLVGQRLELCAQGVQGELRLEAMKPLAWQRRPDKADASCVAMWPQKTGWLKLPQGALFVYADGDWPRWQAAQRRDATARYAARTKGPGARESVPLPSWPFGVLFVLAMLALWWRERAGWKSAALSTF
ncbi:MAG: hypothetical protein V4508_08515 [Pseudomonadota bacterium]